MLPEIRDGWDRLERRKAEFVARLATLSEAERRTPPAPGEWSPLQVLQHLMFVEALEAGPEVALPPDTAERARFGVGPMAKLLAAALRAAVRMPTLPVAEPPDDPGADFEALSALWAERRDDLRGRLETVTDAGRPFARHPMAGPLSARQVLDLCDAHIVYHLKRFPKRAASGRDASRV